MKCSTDQFLCKNSNWIVHKTAFYFMPRKWMFVSGHMNTINHVELYDWNWETVKMLWILNKSDHWIGFCVFRFVWPLISECGDELAIFWKVVNKVNWNRRFKRALVFSCWMLISQKMSCIHLKKWGEFLFMFSLRKRNNPTNKHLLSACMFRQCNFEISIRTESFDSVVVIHTFFALCAAWTLMVFVHVK